MLMIRMIVISERARKQLARVPRRIAEKLLGWVDLVVEDGLEEARRVPGYHDEPLRGDRLGQRSIRLNIHYRAIYEIRNNGTIEFVSVEEVNKHEY